MSGSPKLTILVLSGGESPEREVSLRSGTAVVAAVRALGHTARQLDPRDDGAHLEAAVRGCDVVLPILHGAGGEDGSIQERLEAMGKPYLGSGPVASRLCFDKGVYKEALLGKGLPVAASEVVDRAGFLASSLTHRPYVVKPLTGGSSLDTFIVRQPARRPAGLMEAFDRYPALLLEELVEGVEMTVGVLTEEALPVVEIIPPVGQEFDYTNKYNGATQELCPPAHIGLADQEQARALAVAAHRLADCRHLSRTDMILTSPGQFFILETNTMPGLTEQSLYPKAAAAAGMSWERLVERFIELARLG